MLPDACHHYTLDKGCRHSRRERVQATKFCKVVWHENATCCMSSYSRRQFRGGSYILENLWGSCTTLRYYVLHTQNTSEVNLNSCLHILIVVSQKYLLVFYKWQIPLCFLCCWYFTVTALQECTEHSLIQGCTTCSVFERIRLANPLHFRKNLETHTLHSGRCKWPHGLRRRCSASRLLRLWVRIPPGGAWMFVCCECCVLSGRGLCDGLITRSEESYRLGASLCVNKKPQKRGR